MKKSFIIIGVLVLIVVMFGGCYNSMNGLRLNVDQSWADVQSSYQRRADLIPNLVATVKGAADFEKSTYVAVAQARAGALRNLANTDASKLTPEKLAEIQKASAEAQIAARNVINFAFEQYPQLKANQNFLDLQTQLEGTENRIKVSRDKYNEAVKDYNLKITNFPANLFAGILGFKPRVMFQADAGADKAPKVQF